MTKPRELLRIHEISKSFPATERGGDPINILSEINLEIAAGTSVAITGNSGSGKSTLLHIAAGLLGADSGSVHLAGNNLTTMHSDALSRLRSEKMGFIFQSSLLLEDFSAVENVQIAAMVGGHRRNEARKLAIEMLNRVRLSDRLHHRSDQLSGGEKQRVAIARALVNKPAILFADEPTGSLDEENALIVEEMLFSLVTASEVALLLVTHNPVFAQRCTYRYHLSERSLEAVE